MTRGASTAAATTCFEIPGAFVSPRLFFARSDTNFCLDNCALLYVADPLDGTLLCFATLRSRPTVRGRRRNSEERRELALLEGRPRNGTEVHRDVLGRDLKERVCFAPGLGIL